MHGYQLQHSDIILIVRWYSHFWFASERTKKKKQKKSVILVNLFEGLQRKIISNAPVWHGESLSLLQITNIFDMPFYFHMYQAIVNGSLNLPLSPGCLLSSPDEMLKFIEGKAFYSFYTTWDYFNILLDDLEFWWNQNEQSIMTALLYFSYMIWRGIIGII